MSSAGKLQLHLTYHHHNPFDKSGRYLLVQLLIQIYELPPISTGYVSAALRLRHASGADTFHFSHCVNPHQVRCAVYQLRPSSSSPEPSGTDTQDFYFWRMLEHDAEMQMNLAWSRQEVKRRNNKLPVTGTLWPRDASCLPYCAVADSDRNRWGLPDGGRQSKSGSELQRSGSSGNWGLQRESSG